MSPVLSPPPRQHVGTEPPPALDPEALIEEARRRARRRRAGWTAAALIVIAIALGAYFGFGGGTRTPPRSGTPSTPSRGLPPAGDVVGMQRVPPSETVLFAARAGTLFEVSVPRSSRNDRVTLMRVSRNGTVARRRARIDRAVFLMDLSTGPDGLYAGTAVVKRFVNAPDELVRIDPATLTVRAHGFFPSRVAAVEQGGRMWASLGDGRVLRLDPRTLAVAASRRLLPRRAALLGLTLSKPAVGLGSLWVIAGDERGLDLVRMDPVSLAVRSRTRIPKAGALNAVVADPHHAYLAGQAVAPVAGTGRLRGRPTLVRQLQTVGIHGDGLVGLTYPPAVELLTPAGRIRARTRFLDAGAQLVVSGRDVWFSGNAGHGNGIVHVRLRAR